ncbi:hypothetical protein RN001_015558 [Aquatica leii]|uniref:Peroxisomal ATPase PEX6 n=1 Tax=Aquatica leii TaxID=1421715 RepID=A0AAN7PPV4_9COLE|nr:hypothetical protein RN001_015558 [Aquatica leii]
MDIYSLKNVTKILAYSCRLRFPKYPSYYFPFYMLIIYNHTRKLKQMFKLVAIPDAAIAKFCSGHGLAFCDDVNNSIVVSKTYLDECKVTENFVRIRRRFAYIIGANIKAGEAVVSDTFRNNLNLDSTKLEFVNSNCIPILSEINLSVINTYHDLSNSLVESLVKNYFKTPKILHTNDVICVDFRKYAPEFYFTSHKFMGLKNVYFKCNKLYVKQNSVTCGLCMLSKTDIKQSANVQSFVAPVFKSITCDFTNCEDYDESLIDCCPYGLKIYMDKLERSIKPFLKKNTIQLKPTFLVQGSKGSGKTLMIASLASKLGLHLYEANSGDLTAPVYAQTETKIRNLFFKARLCTPCVLLIKHFENFSKNNEGVHDERIISFFKTEIESLFELNSYPLILICVSNSKEVPVQLSRDFLEVFEVSTPGTQQRYENLAWILRLQNLKHEVHLENVAEKTHGFLFEDLRALTFFAQKCCLDEKREVLVHADFDNALDLMQSKYSQSLGAPKIPKVQWSDVGGLTEVKHEIIRTINLPLQHPDLLRNTGLKRSGILLYGPPGTGKTLIAKAVATECNLCFLSVKGPELLNMYVGQSEQNVREVFERAREASPCIIFFDELDSLAPNRGISGDSGGVMDRVVSQLLAEMDGLNQSATIFIIGATNRPDLIDPALLRPGRFDKLLYVGPCTDLDSKISVLKALTRKFKLDRSVNLEDVVKICPKNITGADFYGLCSVAWLSCVRKLIEKTSPENLTSNNVIVTMDDFKTALKDLKPSIKPEDLAYFQNLQKQYTSEYKIKK